MVPDASRLFRDEPTAQGFLKLLPRSALFGIDGGNTMALLLQLFFLLSLVCRTPNRDFDVS